MADEQGQAVADEAIGPRLRRLRLAAGLVAACAVGARASHIRTDVELEQR
jgi:hypothetical protein